MPVRHHNPRSVSAAEPEVKGKTVIAPTCLEVTSLLCCAFFNTMLARRFLLAVILQLGFVGIVSPQSTRPQPTHDDSWRAPLANRNQFPPAFLFIALEPERATVLSKGERRLFVNVDYSNILVLQDTMNEDLEVDLESLRVNLQVKYGLGWDFEIAAALQIYSIHAGFLDPFISSYHNALNLPNKVRDREPNNFLRYRWQIDDRIVTEQTEGFSALGDLTLQVKRAVTWKKLEATELAVKAGLKLPTGSRDRFVFEWRLAEDLSSSAPDFTIGFQVTYNWKRAKKTEGISPFPKVPPPGEEP